MKNDIWMLEVISVEVKPITNTSTPSFIYEMFLYRCPQKFHIFGYKHFCDGDRRKSTKYSSNADLIIHTFWNPNVSNCTREYALAFYYGIVPYRDVLG